MASRENAVATYGGDTVMQQHAPVLPRPISTGASVLLLRYAVAASIFLAALTAGSNAFAQTYPGTLSNTVTVTLPGDTSDPAAGNNSATDSNALALQADVTVLKTLISASPALAGSQVAYRIQVSNAGPSLASGVTVIDTLPGELSAISWTCAPVSAGSSCSAAAGTGNLNLSVTLAVGGAVVIDIVGTAPLATPATIGANTASVLMPPSVTDPNPGNNTSTTPPITVLANPLVANDDDASASPVPGLVGGIAVANVLANDSLNGAVATLASVDLSLVSPASHAGVSLNTSNGQVTVAPATPAATYTLTYRICERSNPTNCDTALVTLVVSPAVIQAVDDNAGPLNGNAGGVGVVNVLSNDTVDGGPAGLSQVTLTPTNSGPLTINPSGSVDVAPNTPAGTYTATYQICEQSNPANCDSAVVTVVVAAAAIDAVNDIAGPISGTAGGTAVINVLSNDTLDGVAVVPAQITLTPTNSGPLTINPDGTVDVAPGTPVGTYTASYQICEILNPSNCDTATVSIAVQAALINAADDTAGPVNGGPGAIAVTNVLNNDTLDGVAVVPAQITLTPTNSGPLTINPDGTVDVAPGTPVGTYTASYQICENLNPANCDTATVTVTVSTATINAVDDLAGPVNGASGAVAVINVLGNDLLNGVAVVPAQITLTPTNSGPLTIHPDGTVDVAAGTPVGSYTASYQICENLNPTNCDSATVTVSVSAATIDAVNDTAGPVPGASGGTAVTNVLSNDTLNGAAVVPSQITLTPTNSGPITINGDGTVDVAAGTAAGSYAASYQICEILNPTNCDTAIVNVTVGAASIDAVDDTAGPISGGTGGSGGVAVINVLGNDLLNGVAVVPAQVTLIPASNGPITINPNGAVDVAANTPAGPYTASYQICENLNPTNCDTATVTVTVAAAVIVANDDNASGTPIAGHAGGTAVVNVLANDSLNGAVASVVDVVLSITVPPSNAGVVLNTSNGRVDIAPATPAGSYSLTYQICEQSNPANCDSAVVTVVVAAAAIDAVNDIAGPISGTAGGTAVINVLSNDTLDGVAVVPAQITLTPTNSGPLTINPDGTVDVAPGTPVGTYTASYQICEILNPSNCDTATVSIAVQAALINAADDTAGPVNGGPGAIAVTNVLNNDTLDGVAVVPAQITLTPTNSGPLTINPDGTVDVAPGTPVGTYTASYQICENLNPANCDTATVTVTVSTATINAVDDLAGPVNGASGAVAVINVLGNDLLNGVAVVPAQITLTPTNSGPLTIHPDGTVDVAAGTPVGSYTASYQICENLNPTNCDSATVTVSVSAATIDAVNDTAGPVPGASGGTAVTNVLSNDTLNGAAVVPSQITLTPTNSGPITINGDGTVDVAAGTAAGSYAASYQICEILNPTNCDTAIVNVTVGGATIDAVDDVAGPVNGATGAIAVINVLTNDQLNGAPLSPALVTLIPTNVSPLTINADGSVDVVAGTPGGSYSANYRICENLNPVNCDSAIVTVTVSAAVIDAVDDQAGPVGGAQGATALINVLDNDTLGGAPANSGNVLLAPVSLGPITINADGTLDVAAGTPPGTYTAGYRICDASDASRCDNAIATVVVVATLVEAVDDAGSTPQNVALTVPVLGNDLYNNAPVQPSQVTVTAATDPAHGTVTIAGNGVVSYMPDANYSGADTFDYTVCETQAPSSCSTATVSIVVLANQVTAVDDQATTVQPDPVVITVLTNDTSAGAPLDPASLTVSSAPANGTVVCAQGACTYTASAGYSGPDSFVYNICDVSQPVRVCDSATVIVTVLATPVLIRLTKQAGQRTARIGDLVRYTVTAENIGEVDAVAVSLLDTAPAGFTLVGGQVQVDDLDDAGAVVATRPMRVDALDIPVGGRASIVYYLRIGAGVGPGVHTNRAVMQDAAGEAISNVATADVEIESDPLLEDSLILGTVFNDLNGNGTQQPGERGLPGVRIGSVEGLIMETDAYGRFHLVGISGGASARGRNFILKVDTATLPAGSTFTTENPRVRRITPGIPVRFDFGVKIPDGRIGGGSAKAMVELGEVFFESGRATIDAQYEDLFQKIIEPIKSAKGGRLLITAHADAEDLALRRAQAVRTALNERLDAATAAQTAIELRTEIDGSEALVTLDSNVVLGELLFDTDRAAIRTQYQKLIEQIAQNINQRGAGTIEIAGHADARASAEHNLALSQRRADTVFRAIAALISEQARQRLRVVVSATPTPAAMSAGARK